MPLFGKNQRGAPYYCLPLDESYPEENTEEYRQELHDLIVAARDWVELHCGITLTTIERGYLREAAESVTKQYARNYEAEREAYYLIDYPPKEVAYRFLHTAYDLDWHHICDSLRHDAEKILKRRCSAGIAASAAQEQGITLPTQVLMQRTQARLHHE